MTEKHYGGASGIPQPKNTSSAKQISKLQTQASKQKSGAQSDDKNANIEKQIRAGEIVKQAKDYARTLVKKDILLLELAEKIEAKIIELGGKPAFPVNLSINEIAAHATPTFNDGARAHGLLKVDVGAHVDGFVADSAFSVDLENSHENKHLIETAQKALNAAIEKISLGTQLRQIGKAIEDAVKKEGLQPIVNLSGHSIAQYEVHAGLTIPNYDNYQEHEIGEGTYAIEPFVTNGGGKVIDGKPSGIYVIEKDSQVRDTFAREVLAFIKDEYQTLPFCARWLAKKFGTRALIALKRIEEAGIIHHYPQLIEKDRKPVAQAEHTVIITENDKIVIT